MPGAGSSSYTVTTGPGFAIDDFSADANSPSHASRARGVAEVVVQFGPDERLAVRSLWRR